jgi:spermidine/putrescine-binding protein
MIALAMITLAVALAASVWTTAYARTDTLPSLIWLDRARAEDAWLDSVEAMHETLDGLLALDDQAQLGVVALTV